MTGIPTGFIDLDYKTTGMQPSDLVLIAARPSMGKTAFVLNIAQYMAFKKNYTAAIFSLEMVKRTAGQPTVRTRITGRFTAASYRKSER